MIVQVPKCSVVKETYPFVMFVLSEKVVRARAGKRRAGDHLHDERQAPLLQNCWQYTHRRQVRPHAPLSRSLRIPSRIQDVALTSDTAPGTALASSMVSAICKVGARHGASSGDSLAQRALETMTFHRVPTVVVAVCFALGDVMLLIALLCDGGPFRPSTSDELAGFSWHVFFRPNNCSMGNLLHSQHMIW